jgi:hypothetical protein
VGVLPHSDLDVFGVWEVWGVRGPLRMWKTQPFESVPSGTSMYWTPRPPPSSESGFHYLGWQCPTPG